MKFLDRLFGKSKSTTPVPDPAIELLTRTYRFVALDVETANGDAASICQLGLALTEADGSVHSLSYLIDPETHFDDFNTNLHGISGRTVHGAPTFADVIQPLRAFLTRHPLVQHSSFDKRAIEAACLRYGLPSLNATWHDSVTIARRAWPKLRGNGGHGLANLKVVLRLDFTHHDAAEDAKAAAWVVLRAEQQTGQSFAELTAPKTRRGKSFEKSISVDGDANGPLFGHVACFTGKLSMSRTEAATLAADAGISVKSGMSKKITLLVVGDQDMTTLAGYKKSSKHRHAEKLAAYGHSIRIINESGFRRLISNHRFD